MTLRLKTKKKHFSTLIHFSTLDLSLSRTLPFVRSDIGFYDSGSSYPNNDRHRKYKPTATAFMKYNIILSRIVTCTFIRFNFLFPLNNITY